MTTSRRMGFAGPLMAVALIAWTAVALFGWTGSAQAQVIGRVSVAGDETQADGSSAVSSTSADGRYVAMLSYAGNLVREDTNRCEDVFAEDVLVATLDPAPTATGLEPARGPMRGGVSVVIRDDNFAGLSGPTAVTFGGVAASAYTVDSTMQVPLLRRPMPPRRCRCR